MDSNEALKSINYKIILYYIIMILCIISIIIIIIIIFWVLYYKKTEHMYSNKIPKNIYLCYKTKNIPDYIIPNWEKLNPNYTVKLYDNTDCIKFLQDEYGEEYVDIFNYMKDGPIKADLWRVCILYKYGGVYCDIDVEPLVPFIDYMEDDIDFLTCISMAKNELNPHIIMTIPNNIILKQCIDKYIEKYRNKIPYEYWEYSIVYIMASCINDNYNQNYNQNYKDNNNNIFKYIYNFLFGNKKYLNNEGIYTLYNMKCQFIKEIDAKNLSDIYCMYNNTKILNNRYKEYSPHNHGFT